MQPDSLEFWIDMNLPSVLAEWIRDEHELKAKTFSELDFENTKDYEVFEMAALNPCVVVITTKDYDFVDMTELAGSIPKVLYINIGNVTNKQLKEIFHDHFPEAIKLLSKTNQQLIEITN